MKTACRSKIDGDEIQKISIKFFEQLPKKGKPVKKNERQQEYTVLATILMEDKSFADCELKVIALGTGTRCLGSKQLSDSGTIINDSHAEIICKRAFQKYLYAELKKYFFKKESSILNFNVEKGIWCLKDEIKFHFFVSQAFCGDASMSFLKEKKVLLNENVEEKESFNFFDEKEMENPFKRQKLLLNFSENLIRGRNDIEKLGFCRTKPGRIDSDPTNSMSCTDKVLKWSTLGLNGSMLSNFISPIFFTSITIAQGWNEEDKNRFKSKLFKNPNLNAKDFFIFDVKEVEFKFCKTYLEKMGNTTGKILDYIPCDASICFTSEYTEIIVNGRLQGSKKGSKNSIAKISKIKLLENFFEFFEILEDNDFSKNLKLFKTNCNLDHLPNLNYHELKNLNLDYIKNKKKFLECNPWIKKSEELEKFKLLRKDKK